MKRGATRGMEFHCDSLLLNSLIFIAGLWCLLKGSDLFVDSAAAIARIWKVSELVIGLTLVSIGTSLPEFASSFYAACAGETDFIIGNVIGSNATNITLILGAGVLCTGTLTFSPQLFSRDAILMLGAFVVTNLMVFATTVQGRDGVPVHGINIWSGILLLLMGIGYCLCLFRSNSEKTAGETSGEASAPPSFAAQRRWWIPSSGARNGSGLIRWSSPRRLSRSALRFRSLP